MLEYELPTFTLGMLEEAYGQGYGDLLDPVKFLAAYKEAAFAARLTHRLAIFYGVKPTYEEFADSIEGKDLPELRRRLYKAYVDFFPPRLRVALKMLGEEVCPETKEQTAPDGECAQ